MGSEMCIRDRNCLEHARWTFKAARKSKGFFSWKNEKAVSMPVRRSRLPKIRGPLFPRETALGTLAHWYMLLAVQSISLSLRFAMPYWPPAGIPGALNLDSFGNFGPSMSSFVVRTGLEMILSHRAPSSFNMSSYRAMWTHFRSNSMIFINLIFNNYICELQISGHLSPQPSGRRKT